MRAGERRIAAVHELGAFLDGRGPAASRSVCDAAAGARARLDDGDVGAARAQARGGGEPGHAGADDDDVVHQPARSATGKSASSVATPSVPSRLVRRPVTTSVSGRAARRAARRARRSAALAAAPRSCERQHQARHDADEPLVAVPPREGDHVRRVAAPRRRAAGTRPRGRADRARGGSAAPRAPGAAWRARRRAPPAAPARAPAAAAPRRPRLSPPRDARRACGGAAPKSTGRRLSGSTSDRSHSSQPW